MSEILFLNPVFKEKLWGGDGLKRDFDYQIPSEHTGECWAISAHEDGDCTIANGSYKGITLSRLWKEHRELFGHLPGDHFPLLVKIIDAKEDLSIQVHPNDNYAQEFEQLPFGKTECWYILSCADNSTIVVGHHAHNKEELKQMIEEGRFMELLNTKSIQKGDFLQINPGTLHAIKAGTMLLETQQNSDITYRVYDYDRLEDGKPRILHLQKSIEVIECPYKEYTYEPHIIKEVGHTIEELICCECYRVNKILVNGIALLQQDHPFLLCSVIDGAGCVDQYTVKKGDHFIIPYNYGSFKVSGQMNIIVSHT